MNVTAAFSLLASDAVVPALSAAALIRVEPFEVNLIFPI